MRAELGFYNQGAFTNFVRYVFRTDEESEPWSICFIFTVAV